MKFFGLLYRYYKGRLKYWRKKIHIYAKDSSCPKVVSKKLQFKAKVKSPTKFDLVICAN